MEGLPCWYYPGAFRSDDVEWSEYELMPTFFFFDFEGVFYYISVGGGFVDD
jgi:hypothetical protein